jgi:tRNA-modifying protein YgfZ
MPRARQMIGMVEPPLERPVVRSYGSVAAEYAALRERAIVVDRSARGRLRLSGPRALETVSGLVTADLAGVHAGHGAYAAALTAKGKIIADLRIFVDETSIIVDCAARATDGWMATVRKFVNPRAAAYRDEAGTLRDIGVFGPTAHHVVSALTGASAVALASLPLYGQLAVSMDDDRILVARVPDLGVEGFDLFVPAQRFETIWNGLTAAGAIPAGLDACEIARIEAGRPEYGIDIDDSTLPQEAHLEELGAISYTKGCYVGQEVVARIHFRGHVNRRLMGLRAAGSEPPPRHAALVDAEGKEVGDVRSAVASPRLGGIALGMVRREIDSGARLTARWADGVLAVDVVPLPFPG